MSSTPTSPTGPPNPSAPTHVVAVLFRAAPALETLHARLRRLPAVTDVVAERDHVRLDTPVGVVHASTYGAPWPDEDPESLAELGGVAASLYPGALARAGDQSALWPGGALAASAHRGFVHLIVAEAVGAFGCRFFGDGFLRGGDNHAQSVCLFAQAALCGSD